jgi:hypothetical protein
LGFHHTLRGTRYVFADLGTLLARASPPAAELKDEQPATAIDGTSQGAFQAPFDITGPVG